MGQEFTNSPSRAPRTRGSAAFPGSDKSCALVQAASSLKSCVAVSTLLVLMSWTEHGSQVPFHHRPLSRLALQNKPLHFHEGATAKQVTGHH